MELPTHQVLRRLSYFAAIVDAGSIKGAADKLCLSAPVVSIALSELEQELGVTLLNRTTRSLYLTESGKQVYANANRMLEFAYQALRIVNEDGTVGGKLSLTLPSELSTTLLPPILKNFREIAPHVEIEVDIRDGLTDMTNGEFDIALRAVFVEPSAEPHIDESDLIAVTPLTLVGGPDIETLGTGSPTRKELLVPMIRLATESKSTLVAYDTKEDREQIFHFATGFTVSSKETARELAKQGFGAALLMEPTVQDDLKSGALKLLAPNFNFGYVATRLIKRDKFPSRPVEIFENLLKATTMQSVNASLTTAASKTHCIR